MFVKKFLEFSEYLGIKYASSVVADNVVIQKHLYDRHKKTSFLIEYGGDNAEYVKMDVVTEKKYGIKAGEYAFKVCRIVPENNIDLILEAFSRVNIKLILIGNWNFSNYGKCVRQKYEKFNNLTLLDPIYDQKILDELRGNCFVYVHGHSVGGTNPSLVEAMSLSLCCLVYDINYNRETTENSAIYFDSVESLLDKINFIIENKKMTNEIGLDLAAIAKRRYKWENIVKKYNYVISELLNQFQVHNSNKKSS